MTEWNDDMSAAPKDTLILIAHHKENMWRGKVCIGYFHSDYNGHKHVVTEHGVAGCPIFPPPTHWMPLPPPPTAIAEDA